MPNITFSTNEAGGSGGRTAVVGIRTANTELNQFIRDLVLEAAQEGKRVAEIRAPQNKSDPFRNKGRTIQDAIRISDSEYRAGGLGGGGQYRVELIADGSIAPHIRYVYEGTIQEGRGNIGPRTKRALAFPDGGKEFVRHEVKGQRPQQEWWKAAQEAMEAFIQGRVRSSGIGEAVRK